MLNLRLSTDSFGRILLSSDIVKMYKFDGAHEGNPARVELGYVAELSAIAIRKSVGNDPTAAHVDKRGYISARRLFRKSRIKAEPARYEFDGEQDGWLIFVRETE